MASYGSIYRFNVLSQNGADVSIVISKKGYAGVAHQRSLGRAPILKRERNGNILGTSLEIFAESKAGGEFAQLYTSSADEYRVEVYKNQTLQWVGFVSPELYAEPDIAPPYDVQIIATDGLGELKNCDFTQGVGPRSFGSHMNSMLENTSLNLDIEVMSQLQYYDEAWTGNTDIMSIMVDMSHMTQESCYDVLQSMLASVNACITQQAGKWYLIRESDIYNLVDRLSPVSFGSMNACSWWPIGNLSTDVVPAKKSVNLISESQYKTTVLENSQMTEDAAWEKELNARYDEDEGAYRLPGMGSAIRQKVSFHAEVDYLLMLNISARNIGDGEDSQKLGVMVKMRGRTYQAGSEFWLLPREDRADRYLWMDSEQYIEFELPASSASDTRSDAERIEIRIPLYKYDNRSYAYATEIEVTLFNSTGNMAMLIQECTLTQYERTAGSMITAVIGNNAREAGDEIELAFSDGEYAFPAADVFRNALPLAYDSEGIIKKWRTQFVEEGSYYSVMAKDYAMQVALPRLRYKGKLNVPAMATPVIPLLFEREATYYFLDTYSYDLLNDELEVELISIANASVTISKETISALADKASPSVQGGGESAGGSSTTVITPSLEGLTDTVISSPKNGHTLIYENGKWVNKNSAGGSAALDADVVAGVAVGFISKNFQLPAGLTFSDFVEMMFSQGVKIVPPLVSLVGVPTQAIEVGTEVTLNITSSFKDGYFANTDECTTAAGCQPGTASFALNGLPVTMPHTFVASSAAVNTISVSQSYEASTVKPTKGGAELTDTIPAGTARADSTFVVGYRAFWGYATDDEAESIDSDAIRGLEHTDTIINPTQNAITLLNAKYEIPGGQDIIIAVPEGYALGEVKDEDGDFAKAFKALDDVVVKCAGTATKTYKVYRFDNGTPYPMEILSITIKKA